MKASTDTIFLVGAFALSGIALVTEGINACCGLLVVFFVITVIVAAFRE